ncbi:MAG: S9 family peptidase, partial [Gemmatimonadetes bacterium]
NPDGTTDLLAADARTGERHTLIDGATLIPPGERRPIAIQGYQWSSAGDKLLLYTRVRPLFRRSSEGEYFVYELATASLQPVSVEFGLQRYAKFSPDGTKVGFVRDNDLYVVDLDTGVETRLTHDGGEDIINGTFDWVYEEELSLSDGWRWSPDGSRIAFWRVDQSPVKTFYMIDDLQLYAQPIPLRYPKAGDPNSFVSVGVIDLASGSTTWMDLGDNPDTYVARMDWAASSDELVVQRLNRHQNRLDVLLADAGTGASRVILTETSDTWLDVDPSLDFHWLDGGEAFLWRSERDGFSHLYRYARDGRLLNQVTKGSWDVDDLVGVDAEGGWLYYTAGKDGPLERALYRVRLDGGRDGRLSEGRGTFRANMSPDASLFIGTSSRAGRPPRVGLYEASGTLLRTLVDNERLATQLDDMGLEEPEFFTFTTSDGVELNGWMIRPPDFDPSRRYPVLMYVYGGPGSQTVTDAWGGTRYLWHQLLAERGYIVVSVDNRGTGARGRDFKNVTYLDLGNWESHDQIEAARYLQTLPYVDAGRIGIWGWSYGGYMTLLTMMKGGDLFRAGISVAPVTHWKYYDTIYTERYMRTPRENPEGYRRSAPTENVAGLTGDLLLVHGTGDDNVHFQQSVDLVQRLQEAGKQFDLMIYPNKTHGIGGVRTRLHHYTLMLDWLEEHLGGSPAAATAAGAGGA